MYDEADWLPCYSMEDLSKLTKDQVTGYRVFSGHFSDSLYVYLDQPPTTITWLREPISRTVSHFVYSRKGIDAQIADAQQQGKTKAVERLQAAKNQSLLEFCRSAIEQGGQDNLQVRHLAGTAFDDRTKACDAATLESAKQRLMQMFHFGIVEWMDPSLDLLSWRLSRPHRPLAYRLNTAKRQSATESLDDEQLELLRQLNRFDIQLYQFAKHELGKRLNEFFAQAQAEMNVQSVDWMGGYRQEAIQNRIRQALKNRFLNQPVNHAAKETIEVDFSRGTMDQGWLPRSSNRQGLTVRWAGPGTTSSIFVPLHSTCDYEFTFTARHFMRDYVVKRLKVSVNGFRIPLKFNKVECSTRRGYEFEVCGRIPGEAIEPDKFMTEVVLQTVGTYRQKMPAGDRKVSFATDGFRFEKLDSSERTRFNVGSILRTMGWKRQPPKKVGGPCDRASV